MRPPFPLLLLLLPAACDPYPSVGPRPEKGGEVPHVDIESRPGRRDGDLPTRFELSVRAGPGVTVASGDVVLARGTLSAAAIRSLAQGTPSDTLRRNLVSTALREQEGAIIVSPLEALEPGQLLTLALPSVPMSIRLSVGAEAPSRLLRVFPPPDVAPVPFYVACAEGSLPGGLQSAGFDDARVTVTGGVPGGPEIVRCVTVTASEDRVPSPPGVRAGDEMVALLPPAELVAGASEDAPRPASCKPPRIEVGAVCVTVEDDRAELDAGTSPALLVVRTDRGATMLVGHGQPLRLRGLPPDSTIAVEIVRVGVDGVVIAGSAELRTGPARPHLVLTEVLADPEGAEPDGEMVELWNDGSTEASLGGLLLEDGGGSMDLPDARLAPGQVAVVANQGFDWRGVPDGTLRVEVPHLGTKGLSNAGERLVLRSPDGAELSRFPASPRPRPGESVQRAVLDGSDDDAATFLVARPTPGEVPF